MSGGHLHIEMDDDDRPNGRLEESVSEETRWGVYSAPAGFKTDFASVPRLFWNILPPVGRYTTAAVIHDCLYRTLPHPVTRARADGIFRDIMRRHGVGWLRRWVMWGAVRTFGFMAWK